MLFVQNYSWTVALVVFYLPGVIGLLYSVLVQNLYGIILDTPKKSKIVFLGLFQASSMPTMTLG